MVAVASCADCLCRLRCRRRRPATGRDVPVLRGRWRAAADRRGSGRRLLSWSADRRRRCRRRRPLRRGDDRTLLADHTSRRTLGDGRSFARLPMAVAAGLRRRPLAEFAAASAALLAVMEPASDRGGRRLGAFASFAAALGTDCAQGLPAIAALGICFRPSARQLRRPPTWNGGAPVSPGAAPPLLGDTSAVSRTTDLGRVDR